MPFKLIKDHKWFFVDKIIIYARNYDFIPFRHFLLLSDYSFCFILNIDCVWLHRFENFPPPERAYFHISPHTWGNLTCGSWALDFVRWERLCARAHENTIKREQANEWASSIVVHTNNEKDMTVICEGGYIASSYLLMTRQFTYRSLYQLK